MSNDNRNSDTFEFKPEAIKKRQVERRENDEYSAARRNYEGRQQPEKNGNGLIILAVVLTILLIVTIVSGIFILKGDKNEENLPENPENNTVIDITEEEEKEEEEEEVKNITVSCSMVFYADSVIKKNGGYTILADLYDKDFYKFDNRKLTINSDTNIRESGKRLSPEALVYIIESMAGESLVFEGEIKEEDGTVLSITFDSSFREELEEEEQKPEENNQESQNGETTEGEEKPQENVPEGETNPPAENNTQNAEGAVVTQ